MDLDLQSQKSSKQSQNVDPSYKMDLDFWDCFERKNSLSYSRRNTVITFTFILFQLGITVPVLAMRRSRASTVIACDLRRAAMALWTVLTAMMKILKFVVCKFCLSLTAPWAVMLVT